MIKKIFVFSLVLLILIEGAFALGTFPGRTTIDFVPGLEETVKFTIVNSEERNVNLVISAQGELQDYVHISENVIKMAANEASREISYSLKLPQKLEPGLRTADVVIVQLPDQFVETGQMSVGAAVAVLTQVHVNVPYPGKYGEINLNVLGPDEKGAVTFAVPVFSKGEFALIGVKGTIDIYTSMNEKVATVHTNEVAEIPGQGRAELIAEWDVSSSAPGPYRAEATVTWGEGTEKIEKEFVLGGQGLNLGSIEVNDFTLGEIAKFEALVENGWNEKAENAFVEIIVYSEGGNVLADFKSQTYDIESGDDVLMLAFWDTKGVVENTYDSKLFLRFDGGSDQQQDLKLDVRAKEIVIIVAGYTFRGGVTGGGISRGLLIFLIAAIVVLVLANVSWFLYLRKKIGRKK